MLFLEVHLTMLAWKRGWRGWALIPDVAAIAWGAVLGAGGKAVPGAAIVADLLAIAALIAMACLNRAVAAAAPDPTSTD